MQGEDAIVFSCILLGKGGGGFMQNPNKNHENLGGATKPVQKEFWLATNFGTPMRSSN
jgi:hypothetical protein